MGNRKLNLMMRKDKDGNLVVTVCGPTLGYNEHYGIKHEQGPGCNKLDQRNIRNLKITFAGKTDLLESRSGLPESPS